VKEWKSAKRRRSVGAVNGDDPPPRFFVSVDSTGDEVACFHTDLKVLILIGVGAGRALQFVPKAFLSPGLILIAQ